MLYFFIVLSAMFPSSSTEFWVENGAVATIFNGEVTFMLVSFGLNEPKGERETSESHPNKSTTESATNDDMMDDIFREADEKLKKKGKKVRRSSEKRPTKVTLKISTPAEDGDFRATLRLGERSSFSLGRVPYAVVLLEIRKDKVKLLVIKQRKTP